MPGAAGAGGRSGEASGAPRCCIETRTLPLSLKVEFIWQLWMELKSWRASPANYSLELHKCCKVGMLEQKWLVSANSVCDSLISFL